MRIRWRNLELPTRVTCKRETLTPEYGEFVIEPFERGFGRTIGNSLRRILLSSIEGSAVTSIKISHNISSEPDKLTIIPHEFSTIPGIFEDVTDIIINIKKLRLKIDEESSVKIVVSADKKGPLFAQDIKADSNVVIVNKDLLLSTLTENMSFKIEMEARRGRGYVSAEENMKEPQEIGVIPVASIFSPVLHVEYKIENTRVGKMTNYDRLNLQIRTDGTVSPEMALVEGAKILRKHLNPFIQYFELGQELKEGCRDGSSPEDEKDIQELLEKLKLPIEVLELSVRASNCLAAEGIRTLQDLVKRSEPEMLKIRNFGKTSLKEVKEKLCILELSLGMEIEKMIEIQS